MYHLWESGSGRSETEPPLSASLAGTNNSGHLLEVAVCTEVNADYTMGSLPARLTRLTARFTGLCFVDRDGTATKLFALEPLNGGFSRLAVRHLNKAKPTWATGIAVGNDLNSVHNAILLEELAQVMVRGVIRQITNKDIHRVFLWK